MTNTQKIIVAGASIVAIGVFMVSDFKWLMPKDSKKGTGTANADGNPDPYMMLEVNQKEFPNASGDCGCLKLNDLTLKK